MGMELTGDYYMRRRHKLSKGHSKAMFSHHGSRTHKRNIQHVGTMPMRGGIRL